MQLSKKAIYFFAVILVLGFARLRFLGIFDVGVNGFDSFQYWGIADLWSKEKFVLNNLDDGMLYFRPVFYGFSVLFSTMFNWNDYSIKLMNGVFETVTILCLFYFSFNLTKKALWAFSAIIFYILTPASLVWSQQDLTHTMAGTFVLASFCLLLLNFEKRFSSNLSTFIFFLAGLLMSCGFMSHGSVVFFAPITVTIILLVNGGQWEFSLGKKVPFQGVVDSLSYSVGFFLFLVIGALTVGWDIFVKSLNIEKSIRHGTGHTPLSLFENLLKDGIAGNTSIFTSELFRASSVLVIFYVVFKLLRRNKVMNSELMLPLFVSLSWTIIFSFYFKDISNARMLIPLIPIYILTIVCNLYFISFTLPVGTKRNIFLGLSLILICLGAYKNIEWRYGTIHSVVVGRDKSEPRYVFDKIGKSVSKEDKLLIVSYFYRAIPYKFNIRPYFVDNAIYLENCQTSFEEYIKENSVKYLYFPEDYYLDRRQIQRLGDKFGSCWKRNVKLSKFKEERTLFIDYIGKKKNTVIFNNKYGTLVKLTY